MRLTFVILVGAMLLTSAVSAQTAPGAASTAESTGYIEGVAQAAFGNVTSQSYGVEGGVTVAPRLVVFGEFGRVSDAIPSGVSVAAETIAGYLSQTNSNVTYSARQPVIFGQAGVKYLIPLDRGLEPYVLGGFGIAHYTRDVKFLVGGTDITDNIAQYGVALGSDLSGSSISPMLSFGGGVAWTPRPPLVIDFQFRYGRVFADGDDLNITRAGVGLGIRF